MNYKSVFVQIVGFFSTAPPAYTEKFRRTFCISNYFGNEKKFDKNYFKICKRIICGIQRQKKICTEIKAGVRKGSFKQHLHKTMKYCCVEQKGCFIDSHTYV